MGPVGNPATAAVGAVGAVGAAVVLGGAAAAGDGVGDGGATHVGDERRPNGFLGPCSVCGRCPWSLGRRHVPPSTMDPSVRCLLLVLVAAAAAAAAAQSLDHVGGPHGRTTYGGSVDTVRGTAHRFGIGGRRVRAVARGDGPFGPSDPHVYDGPHRAVGRPCGRGPCVGTIAKCRNRVAGRVCCVGADPMGRHTAFVDHGRVGRVGRHVDSRVPRGGPDDPPTSGVGHGGGVATAIRPCAGPSRMVFGASHRRPQCTGRHDGVRVHGRGVGHHDGSYWGMERGVGDDGRMGHVVADGRAAAATAAAPIPSLVLVDSHQTDQPDEDRATTPRDGPSGQPLEGGAGQRRGGGPGTTAHELNGVPSQRGPRRGLGRRTGHGAVSVAATNEEAAYIYILDLDPNLARPIHRTQILLEQTLAYPLIEWTFLKGSMHRPHRISYRGRRGRR
ncbi:MAG: hypothetical protein CMQ41_12020 [Gammaproteobacteria bacterium]|nr:hypothetical protein [Gammaproteobacteria bacterium]